MPYWGYGSYSEKIIKDTIDILFKKQDRFYINTQAVKNHDPKICYQLYGDKLQQCLMDVAKTITKASDCASLKLNKNSIKILSSCV